MDYLLIAINIHLFWGGGERVKMFFFFGCVWGEWVAGKSEWVVSVLLYSHVVGIRVCVDLGVSYVGAVFCSFMRSLLYSLVGLCCYHVIKMRGCV